MKITYNQETNPDPTPKFPGVYKAVYSPDRNKTLIVLAFNKTDGMVLKSDLKEHAVGSFTDEWIPFTYVSDWEYIGEPEMTVTVRKQ